MSAVLLEKLPWPLRRRKGEIREREKNRGNEKKRGRRGKPVVAEDEDGPEHGALGGPVEGPDEGGVEAEGGGDEGGDDEEIAEDVGEGAEGALDPAMRGDGGADVGDPERGWRRGVEGRGLGGRRRWIAHNFLRIERERKPKGKREARGAQDWGIRENTTVIITKHRATGPSHHSSPNL